MLLIALCSLLSDPVPFRDLWQPDETRYAEISREMLLSGNWVVPHFYDLRYFEKPIAGYWINNFGQLIFGHNNFGVRAGAIICTTLSAMLIYWLGKRMFPSRKIALTASVIFLTSLLVYGIGTYAVLDPILLLWLVAAMCSFGLLRRRTVLTAADGVCAARRGLCHGVHDQGFSGAGGAGAGDCALVLWQRRFGELLRWGPLTVLVAAAISAPGAVHSASGRRFLALLLLGRTYSALRGERCAAQSPVLVLPAGVGGRLSAVARPAAGRAERRMASASAARCRDHLLSWVVLPLLFFSIAKGKLPTYILPCFAPLALLMAHYAHGNTARLKQALVVNGWINLLFGLVATLLVVVVLAPGLAHHPVYARDELLRVLCCAGICRLGGDGLVKPENRPLATGCALPAGIGAAGRVGYPAKGA